METEVGTSNSNGDSVEPGTIREPAVFSEETLKTMSSDMETVFRNVTDYANECTSLISALCYKLENGDITTDKGLSFLEMKNHLLLQYLVGITGISLNKNCGKSIQGSTYIDQLIELRTVMEKIRPIDNKLKYQVDKLVRNATSGSIEADPLRHKANPDNLVGADDDSSDEDEPIPKQEKTQPGVYHPPRVAPQYYDGEEEAPIKKAEKAKKTFINRSLIREMQEELLDTPVEIHNRGDSYSFEHQRKAKEKQRFEESYMTRLPTTKQDRHNMNSISTMGVLGDEITDFKGRSSKSGSKTKGTKRKFKGKKGGGKKKFRK